MSTLIPPGMTPPGSNLVSAVAAATVTHIQVVTGRVRDGALVDPLMPTSRTGEDGLVWLAVNTLPAVIANLQFWIMGILASVASLFLVIGGLRYVTAGGDPGEVEKAKGHLKSALVGYALAALAPILLQILQGILGV